MSADSVDSRVLPAAADLFGDIDPEPEMAWWRRYLPGLVVVLAATMAAGFLSDHYGAPLTLMALLIGLALNFLSADARLTPGFTFASRSLLRWGIVLVGARVTFGQIASLGAGALLALVMIVGLTIVSGIVVARRLGLGTGFGMLAGGAVAICGASAAMALATTLGERRVTQYQLTLVLVGISAMSAMAMAAYPLFAHALRMGDARAGFLLGGSIHDVAQALGAGYSYSRHAGEVAAIVKLARVAMLAPVLAIVAFFLPGRPSTKARIGVPWFVVGFFLFVSVNSLLVVPDRLASMTEQVATGLLATAVSATAIRSPMHEILGASVRPLLVILAATLVSLSLALAAAMTFIR